MTLPRFINATAAAVVLLGSAVLTRPVQAAEPDDFVACSAYQIEQVQNYIYETCGGGGQVWVYCSWMGLWEPRSEVSCY